MNMAISSVAYKADSKATLSNFAHLMKLQQLRHSRPCSRRQGRKSPGKRSRSTYGLGDRWLRLQNLHVLCLPTLELVAAVVAEAMLKPEILSAIGE